MSVPPLNPADVVASIGSPTRLDVVGRRGAGWGSPRQARGSRWNSFPGSGVPRESVRRSRPRLAARLVAWFLPLVCWSIGPRVQGDRPSYPADSPAVRFVSALDSFAELTPEAITLIRDSWSKCVDCDAAEFLTQGLALLSPELRQVFDHYDADEYERCARSAAGLADAPNAFISVHARAYEIKALLAMDRPINALRNVTDLFQDGGGRVDAYSYLGGELHFLYGFCLLSDLRYEEAQTEFKRLLLERDDVPERLKLSAQQILTELDARTPNGLGDVVDLMRYSGRQLATADSGPQVQDRQGRIIDLLDQLIEEAEQNEKGGGSSSSSSRSGGARNPTPRTPMQESQLPGGAPTSGPVPSHRRANPADVWGAMPPAERERILQAVRESFPPRYRRLVEQYYAELARKP